MTDIFFETFFSFVHFVFCDSTAIGKYDSRMDHFQGTHLITKIRFATTFKSEIEDMRLFYIGQFLLDG